MNDYLTNCEIIAKRKAILQEIELLNKNLESLYKQLDELKNNCDHVSTSKKYYSCAGNRMIQTNCDICGKELNTENPDEDSENSDD